MKALHLVTVAAALGALVAAPAMASEQIAQKSGCLACHAKDKKLIGPGFNEVAAKYKGQADAPAKLADKVRKGGAGTWGQVPMPAHTPQQINDADLKSVIDWILKG